jgi:hypothetical protein
MSLKLRILLLLQKYASSLDFYLEIDNGGILKTKPYGKSDDFTFPIFQLSLHQ